MDESTDDKQDSVRELDVSLEGATPGSRRTMLGRLQLLEPYLDKEIYDRSRLTERHSG